MIVSRKDGWIVEPRPVTKYGLTNISQLKAVSFSRLSLIYSLATVEQLISNDLDARATQYFYFILRMSRSRLVNVLFAIGVVVEGIRGWSIY